MSMSSFWRLQGEVSRGPGIGDTNGAYRWATVAVELLVRAPVERAILDDVFLFTSVRMLYWTAGLKEAEY